MKTLRTRYYSDKKIVPAETDLAVTDTTGVDIDEWMEEMLRVPALAIIPPYDPQDPAKTSRCADMARSRLDNVGVVVAGTSDREREAFFLWAQENDFAPIVLLPHRSWSRSRQIAQLHTMRALNNKTWIHLPEPTEDFNERSWPGTYTTGEEFVRQV